MPDVVKTGVELAVLVRVPQPHHVPWKTRKQCGLQVVLERPGVATVGPNVPSVWLLCSNRQLPLQRQVAAVVLETLHTEPVLRCWQLHWESNPP